MLRKIIQIDADKCNGCGLCVHACHEGAIGMVDGKAKLLRDDYCDGLGIVCRPVRQGRFRLPFGRRQPMMRQRRRSAAVRAVRQGVSKARSRKPDREAR